MLDDVGNRSDEQITDGNGVVISHSVLAYDARDALTTRNDSVQNIHATLSYDLDGNQTGQVIDGAARSFVFDARDRMVSLSQPNAPPLVFDYDSEGQRLRKTQGPAETRYQYDGHSLLAESNAIGNTLARYHFGATQLLSRTEAGSTPVQRHYLLDALHSPIGLLTQDGAISARTSYDAWGEVRHQQGTSGATVSPNRDGAIADLASTDQQPIGFTGYVKDSESGLYYAKARYYDPVIARFTSEDPEAGKDLQPPSLHRYLYAYANPTVFDDPGGRQSVDINVTSCNDDGTCSSTPVAGSALPFISPSQMATSKQVDALIEAQTRMQLFGGDPSAPMVVQPMLAAGSATFESPYIQHGSSRLLSSMQSSADLDRSLGLEPNYVAYGKATKAVGETAIQSLPPVAVLSGINTMLNADDGWQFAAGATQATLGAIPIAFAMRSESALVRGQLASSKGRISSISQEAKPRVVVETPDSLSTPVSGSISNTTSGPVRFKPPVNATPEEVAQMRAYCEGCNEALAKSELSPSGRVSTKGELRREASRAAAKERLRAEAEGNPYSGHAGHVPDTTWTGRPEPSSWQDLTPRVNSSLGGQAGGYPIGYQPTIFELLEN